MFSVGEKKTSTANKFISGQPTCIFSIMYHKFEKKKKELLVWAGHLFVFNVIRSPKQSLGDLLFLLRFLLLLLLLFLLFLFFFFFFFLSVHRELVHGRSQELQDRIS